MCCTLAYSKPDFPREKLFKPDLMNHDCNDIVADDDIDEAGITSSFQRSKQAIHQSIERRRITFVNPRNMTSRKVRGATPGQDK